MRSTNEKRAMWLVLEDTLKTPATPFTPAEPREIASEPFAMAFRRFAKGLRETRNDAEAALADLRASQLAIIPERRWPAQSAGN